VRQLLSKLVAGGLSAAVILLWWPQFFPADTAVAWLIRGVVWTLSFELLLHALAPVEGELWESRPARTVRSRASAAGDLIGSSRRGLGGRAAVACGAIAVPLALLAFAPTQPAKHAPSASVRHVTEVKRIVRVVRPVRVAKVVPAQSPAAQPAGPAAPITTERTRTTGPIVRRPAPAAPRKAPRTTPGTSSHGNTVATSPQSGTRSGAKAPETAQQQPAVAPRVAA
jgi:hypothetical protein